MKKFNNVWAVTVVTAVAFLFSGFISPVPVDAAGPAAVNLLTSGNFVILSKTGITDVPTSTITGNIGSSPITGAAIGVPCAEVTGTIYSIDAAGPLPCRIINPSLLTTAVSDMQTAYTDAAGRAGPNFTNQDAGILGGTVLVPGLYKWTTDVSIPTDLTITGGASDTWIFQIDGNLSIASATDVLLTGGAVASNIFWQVAGGTGATLGTTSTFQGNILTQAQIIMQTGATLDGRALAQTQVTLDGNTVSLPTGAADGIIHIIKVIINNNDGTAVLADFNLYLKLAGITNVSGSPAVGTSAPGTAYTLSAGTYVVSEDTNNGYTQSFSGDCDGNGTITLLAGEDLTCTLTNNDVQPAPSAHVTGSQSGGGNSSNNNDNDADTDVPTSIPATEPQIHIVVTSNKTVPMSFGGGNVIYTYTVTNPGTLALDDVKVTDNKCSVILYLSGDTNKNKLLNVDEIWKYTCTTYVSKTTTNIAVAEGTADDITVTDDDSVTVLVATPGFPNTGLPPASRAIALVVGAIVLIVISCVISYKKRSV